MERNFPNLKHQMDGWRSSKNDIILVAILSLVKANRYFLSMLSGRKKLLELIALFDIENVYNADEPGLFFQLGPNRTLATKSDRAKGTKKYKE